MKGTREQLEKSIRESVTGGLRAELVMDADIEAGVDVWAQADNGDRQFFETGRGLIDVINQIAKTFGND